MYISHKQLTDQARRGIPQGSSTSPIVATLECAKLQVSHELESGLANYADDFLSLHKTKQDAESAAGVLQESVGKLPGGKFSLKQKGIGHLSEGVVFLGHHIQMIDNKIWITPSEANKLKLMTMLDHFEDQSGVFSTGTVGGAGGHPDKQKALLAIANSFNYLRSWRAAFAACNDLDEALIGMCAKNISLMIGKAGVTPDDFTDVAATAGFHFGYSGWD